jgi:hypothetical protein
MNIAQPHILVIYTINLVNLTNHIRLELFSLKLCI